MPYDDLPGLRITVDNGVATVTLDHPPLNLMDGVLLPSLRGFVNRVRHDTDVRVVVFDSADPEFFVAHVDMTLVDAPDTFDGFTDGLPDGVNVFQGLGELLRHQPQVTIVKLAGIARGGGAEFVAAADMAFAAIGRAGIGQIEALMGIVPGGGGTQYVTGRIGRNRALEAILGADLFDAETAERYGWVNRAVPADQLDVFVDRLAQHIAALAPGVVAAVKRAIAPEDLAEGLLREHDAWAGQVARPAAERLTRAGLATGAQTRAGERDLEGLFRSAASGPAA